MKRYLIVLYTVLVAFALSIATVQRPAIALSLPSQVQSVNVYLNTAYVATTEGWISYCVVSGPNGTIDLAEDCDRVLPGLAKSLQDQHPLVAFNFIIDGNQLGVI